MGETTLVQKKYRTFFVKPNNIFFSFKNLINSHQLIIEWDYSQVIKENYEWNLCLAFFSKLAD